MLHCSLWKAYRNKRFRWCYTLVIYHLGTWSPAMVRGFLLSLRISLYIKWNKNHCISIEFDHIWVLLLFIPSSLFLFDSRAHSRWIRFRIHITMTQTNILINLFFFSTTWLYIYHGNIPVKTFISIEFSLFAPSSECHSILKWNSSFILFFHIHREYTNMGKVFTIYFLYSAFNLMN